MPRTVVLPLLAALTSLCCLLCGTPAGAAQGLADPEARLVWGIKLYRSGSMREGFDEIEAAAKELADLPAARMTYGVVALRSGNFRSAESTFTSILGADTVALIASGEATIGDIGRSIDKEALLGVAVCRGELGAPRESDRLFRAFIDLAGPTSRDAGRAYMLSARMYEHSGVTWGDPEAAEARAAAVAPDLTAREVLPPFPDLAVVDELEPYTRAIVPAARDAARADTLASLPRLLCRTAPTPIEGSPLLPPNVLVRAELLVTENGTVDEVLPAFEADPGEDAWRSALEAASAFVFEPAIDASGSPVPLWILRDVAVPRIPVAVGEPSSE